MELELLAQFVVRVHERNEAPVQVPVHLHHIHDELVLLLHLLRVPLPLPLLPVRLALLPLLLLLLRLLLNLLPLLLLPLLLRLLARPNALRRRRPRSHCLYGGAGLGLGDDLLPVQGRRLPPLTVVHPDLFPERRLPADAVFIFKICRRYWLLRLLGLRGVLLEDALLLLESRSVCLDLRFDSFNSS